MAFDNLMTMEQPWMFRPTFTDAWISDVFTKENDALAMALQNSFSTTSSDAGDVLSAEMVESLFAKPEIPIQTPTASGGSENDAPVSKPRRSLPPSGRVAKRKSRASKRATTTFITADPANFRQMVQQVTGVRFGGLNAAPVVKPEPQRAISRFQSSNGLPTLDTSAFLLDGIGGGSSLAAQPHTTSSAAGIDFDSFCNFPTLESWKVM